MLHAIQLMRNAENALLQLQSHQSSPWKIVIVLISVENRLSRKGKRFSNLVSENYFGKCQIITRLIVFLITPISRFFGYFVWQLHNCTLRDQFLAQPLPVNHSIGFCFRVADFSVSKLSAAHLRSLRVYFGADVKISVAFFLLLHYLCTRKFIELNIFCLNFKVIHEPSQYQNSITHFLPGR